MARTVRRQRPPRRPASAPVSEPASAAPFEDELAQLLRDEGSWAGRSLPPLPTTAEELMSGAEQLLAQSLSSLDAGPRSLQHCCAIGWMLLSTDDTQAEAFKIPDWLMDPDCPVDALDVLFFGASYPGRFRSPVEFTHARDAWLDVLSSGPNRGELVRTVAAAIEVCEELALPVDDNKAWLALIVRMRQAKLGERPLAAQVMPAKALAGHRAVYGPLSTPLPPLSSVVPAEALISFLPTAVTRSTTAEEGLRAGLAVLVAALLDQNASVEEMAGAAGPLHVGAGMPGHGPAEAVAAADELEQHLNTTLGLIDHPHRRAAAHSPDAVRAAVDELGAAGILAALHTGTTPNNPRGTAIRLSLPWAIGLLPSSPLVPITDTLLAAAAAGESGMSALARVCALPGVREPLTDSDYAFRGTTGSALNRLATSAGVIRMSTSKGSLVAIDGLGAARMEAQLEAFEAKFGRPPRPDEPVFFDPAYDVPTPMSGDLQQARLGEYLHSAGLSALTVRASQLVGDQPPVTRFAEQERQQEWDDAVHAAATELGLSPDEAA